MQVLDNAVHPDAMLGKDGNRQAGSLYDLLPAKPQNAKPAGEWNSVEIICYNGTIVHKQNGETVLEYHLWTDDWKKLVKDSKFPNLNEKWADVAPEGYIAFQDHGDNVWYRNVKIKELP
jgi:hydroxymethylpyrimidine pyrophosphatase-like HAD family hydrolase